jgi:hypothetical protein
MKSGLARWLPVGITFGTTDVSVRWIEFGERRLAEPFFPQSIRRMRMSVPPPRERMTSMDDLVEFANGLPPVSPSVVVFHVSRCGSTWLSNALGTGDRVVVLSEARPIGTLASLTLFRQGRVAPETTASLRQQLLDAVIRVCAYHHYTEDAKVVIKCNASSLLCMSTLRSVWPDIPFVVNIRDPLEVMVSNLQLPAGWVRAKNVPLGTRTLFGWDAAEVHRMSDEEYCARGLAAFYEAGLRQLDAGCRVVDYQDLGDPLFREIAADAGISLPARESREYRAVLDLYAKDPERATTFEADHERKKSAATDAMKEAVALWAQGPYEALRYGVSRAIPVKSPARLSAGGGVVVH